MAFSRDSRQITNSVAFSTRKFRLLIKRRWWIAASGTVTLIMCAAWSAAIAQTAHYAGVQTIVASSGLVNPHQMAIDSAGNVYIADLTNNRILKETLTGSGYQESVVASTGLKTPAGVAVDASGNLYVADTGNSRILKETLSAGTYTESVLPITGLSSPLNVAVDASGNLYISDYGNACVLKETLSAGNYIQSQVLSGPWVDGIAIDASGNVYLAAFSYNQIIKMTPSGSGYTTSYVGSGWSSPHGVAVDSAGVVYVADSGNSRIVQEVPSGTTYIQSVVMSTGTVQPQALALDSKQNLFFNDAAGGRILELAQGGANFGRQAVGTPGAPFSLTFTFDTAGTISALSVVTGGAAGLDYSDAGTGTCTTNGTNHTYNIGDTCAVDVNFMPKAPGARYGAALLKNGADGVVATSYIQGTGVGPQMVFSPGTEITVAPSLVWAGGIAVDGSGNLYITNYNQPSNATSVLYKETLSGGSYSLSTIPINTKASPGGIAVDGSGALYVAYGANMLDSGSQIFKLTPSAGGYIKTTVATFPAVFGAAPFGIAVDGAGNVFVTLCCDSGTVLKETLTSTGYVQSTVVSGLPSASGVAVDGDGNVYVAVNVSKGWIAKETPSASGYTESIVPISGGDVPFGIAVDGVGNIFFSYPTGQIMKETLSAGGYIQTTIPTGKLNQPMAVAVDGRGNLYIGNSGYYSILKEDLIDPPSLTFATTGYGISSADSPRIVTLENDGNASLSFPIPLTGSNPSIAVGFALDSSGASACPLLNSNSSTAGTLAGGASCLLPISFVPGAVGSITGSLVLTDNNLNAAGPGYATQSIRLSGVGIKATPQITWMTPSAIPHGTPLSATQLNATASVPGSFTYNPVAGTVLTVGQQTLSVTFTPTNDADYASATVNVTLTVNQAIPSIVWATPTPISYGTALGATQLNATSTVAGSFAYSPAAGTVLTAGSHPITATFTPTDTANYASSSATVTLVVNQTTPSITWATPAAITYGTALSAAQLNATSTVAGSFSYSPAAGTIPGVGTQTLTATLTPTDTNYSTATATVALTVTKGTPAVGLVSSANPAYVTAPITFTATVTGAGTTPSGAVSFLDGTTVLGTGALSGGAASYTTSALAVGAHPITAMYSGDGNFAAVTSAAVTETVIDFTVAPPTGGSTTATATPGGQATYVLAFAPPTGTTFPQAVTFAVAGLPTGATATFSPSTIAAGSAATNVTLTISIPSQAAAAPLERPFGGAALPIALGLILLPFAGRLRKTARLWNRIVCMAVLGIAGLALIAGVSGCGGSSSSSRTPVTYNITVTATSGALSHTTTLTLTVR